LSEEAVIRNGITLTLASSLSRMQPMLNLSEVSLSSSIEMPLEERKLQDEGTLVRVSTYNEDLRLLRTHTIAMDSDLCGSLGLDEVITRTAHAVGLVHCGKMLQLTRVTKDT
jgi:hypothetical protein